MNDTKRIMNSLKPAEENIHEENKPQSKGYRPKTSNLNPSKPPQGGTGISTPKKSNSR